MKQLLLFCALFLLAGSVSAQIDFCEPDLTLLDSIDAGVVPLPYHPDSSPEGGITDSACLNKNLQFVFNAIVGDTFTTQFGAFPLDSLVISTTTAISGLPTGFSYKCNPPSCVFPKESVSCIVIYGKATNVNDIGPHNLGISGTLWSGGFPIPLTFPDPNLIPGEYVLYVHPEDYPNCSVFTSAKEAIRSFEGIRTLPNPFSGQTTIEVVATEAGDFTLAVTDLLGRTVHSQQVRIEEGTNRILFDGSQLADGVYLYTFYNQTGRLSQRMVVSRQ